MLMPGQRRCHGIFRRPPCAAGSGGKHAARKPCHLGRDGAGHLWVHPLGARRPTHQQSNARGRECGKFRKFPPRRGEPFGRNSMRRAQNGQDIGRGLGRIMLADH